VLTMDAMNSRRLMGFPPDQGLHATTSQNEGCVVHTAKFRGRCRLGQNRKSSRGAHVFRFGPESGTTVERCFPHVPDSHLLATKPPDFSLED
jgi:hypothetical protein